MVAIYNQCLLHQSKELLYDIFTGIHDYFYGAYSIEVSPPPNTAL